MPLSQHSDTKQEAEKYSIPRETGFSEALYIQGNQNTSKWNTGILQGHPHLRTGFHRCMLMSWLLVTVAKRYLRAYLRLWFPGRLNLIWLCVRLAFSPLSYAGICAHWIHSISVCGLKRAKKKKKVIFLNWITAGWDTQQWQHKGGKQNRQGGPKGEEWVKCDETTAHAKAETNWYFHFKLSSGKPNSCEEMYIW